MQALIDVPPRWDYFVDNTYYEIYQHHSRSFVMMWNNGRYSKSNRTEAELQKPRVEPTQGNKTGNGHNPNTKQKLALDTITTYGSMTKLDLASMSGMSVIESKNALKALKGKGDLDLNRQTGVYSLPSETQFEMFAGLSL